MSNRFPHRPRQFHRPHLHVPHIHRPDFHGVHIPHPQFRPGETIWFLFDKNLKPRIKNSVFQCTLATLCLIIILLVQNALFSEAIVVSVASTAFTIFVFPDSVASTPRRVIGGQIAAILAGSLIFIILHLPSVQSGAVDAQLVQSIAAALAVGLGLLLMVATNTEHPPAAGVALGIVIDPWQWSAIAFVIVSALTLTAVRAALRPKMINLL